MSVPVRYSAAAAAAANYAVVARSGLSKSLHQEQEEQYNHCQQKQQQQEQRNLFCQLLSNSIDEHQQQQQQQLMQRPSMSLSSSPAAAAATINSSSCDMELMKPTTSAAAARAMAARGANVAVDVNGSGMAGSSDGNGNGGSESDWMGMSDEGRYGTPGAAGLDYQKYVQLESQPQPNRTNTTANNNSNSNNNNNEPTDQPMESAMMDNEQPSAQRNTQLEDELYALSSDELYNTLKEYDVLQDKYHTVLLLPKESRREVTAGGRDGSAYVLRCLKMWYELPSDVLFSAMSLVDRFLDRMAVKPKHMACMSIASFHLAIKQLGLKPIPADDLVTISQCGCTAGDLERMGGVIANKLGVQMGHAPITSVSYLRIYYALFRNLAKEIGGQFFEFYQQLIKLEELENRLEILLCDVKTTVITPSTLALVLICLHLDCHIKESYTRGSPELKHVFDYILYLQQFMRIPDRVFTCGFSIVSGILLHYNGQNKQPYKQRLVWKLSSRTLRVLRPTNRFSSDLPTIEEGISNAMDDGCRSRTDSISSEEEEDWPTSPIIPIFEQC